MNVRRSIPVFFAIAFAVHAAAAQTIDRAPDAAMLAGINAERVRAGVAPLVEDPRLDRIAEEHSLDMQRAGYFSHDSPTEGGPGDRVQRAGYAWTYVAENIALNQSPEAAQDSLVHSPGHYRNMVDRDQRAVGLGIVRQGGRVWVTQLFAAIDDGAPAAPAAPIPVSPAPSPCATPAAPTIAPAPAPATTNPLAELFRALGMSAPRSPPARGARRVVVPTPFGPVRVDLE